MDEEKSELEVLFPEVEIMGIKVRPWSLGQLIDLTPTFRNLSDEFKKRGVKIDNLEDDETIKELVLVFLPQVARIISVSVKEKEESVREWPINKATMVLLTVISQNMEHIKNSFGPGRLLLRQVKKTG